MWFLGNDQSAQRRPRGSTVHEGDTLACRESAVAPDMAMLVPTRANHDWVAVLAMCTLASLLLGEDLMIQCVGPGWVLRIVPSPRHSSNTPRSKETVSSASKLRHDVSNLTIISSVNDCLVENNELSSTYMLNYAHSRNPSCARTYAQTHPSSQRATQLRSVLARV
jgi:hypothetical protein